MRNHLVMQRLSVNGPSSIDNSKKKGDTMTYLEKWFDFNRRQKEIESLLEETIAQQRPKSDLERVLPTLLSGLGSRKISTPD